MKLLIVLTIIAVALIGASTAQALRKANLPYSERLSYKIHRVMQSTHHCQIELNRPRTKVRGFFTRQGVKRRRYVLRKWLQKESGCWDDYRAAVKARVNVMLGSLNCISCWERVANCESGQRWDYNGPSGFDGGLQFLDSTWDAYGGEKYAPYAYQASKMQQIAIASTMSLSHWPVCGARY